MIIDFHTHIFPDFLAERAITALRNSSGNDNAIGGTANNLIDEMEKAGVTYSVNLPILTNPTNFETTLKRLLEQNVTNSKIINFASIHPLCYDIKSKIKAIKNYGFKGVKVHPFFQECSIDSVESLRLIDCLSNEGLITVIHAGKDASYPNIERSAPKQILNMFRSVQPQKIVLAHMGGLGYHYEVLSGLCGINAYFDTSFCLDEIPGDIFKAIIKAHGDDKILFGTDSPWKAQHKFVQKLRELNLSNETTGKVFYENACKLLNISPVIGKKN